MSRSLSALSSLEVLRGEAKRWLRALSSGDAEALVRLRRSLRHTNGATTSAMGPGAVCAEIDPFELRHGGTPLTQPPITSRRK